MDFERRIAASTELLRAPILIIQPFASFATFCSNLFLPSVKAELTLSAPSRSSSNPLLPLLPSVQIFLPSVKAELTLSAPSRSSSNPLLPLLPSVQIFLPSVKAELTLSAPSRSSSNPLLPLLPSVQISFTFCKSRTYPVGTLTVIIQPFASFATFCSNLFYLL
jgi:hypothetical protein